MGACDSLNCGAMCDDIRYGRSSSPSAAGTDSLLVGSLGVGVQDQSKANLPECQLDADYFGKEYLPKLFSKIRGIPHDPSKTKFCYVDNKIQSSGKTRVTEWAETLASVDGDTISITHLSAWSEAAVITPVDGGTTIATEDVGRNCRQPVPQGSSIV